MEGLITLEKKLEEAVRLVKDFGAEDRVKAGILWNSYSAQLQTIINSAIVETNDEIEDSNSIASGTTKATISTATITSPKLNETDSLSLLSIEPSLSTATSTTGNYNCCSQEVSDEDYDEEICSNDNHGSIYPKDNKDGGSYLDDVPSSALKISEVVHVQNVDLEDMDETEMDKDGSDTVILNLESPATNSKISVLEMVPDDKSEKVKASYLEHKFKCGTCNKGFLDEDELKRHIAKDHPKLFKCEECEASFSTKGNFNVHKRKHTGDRPFPCPKCTNRFTTSGNLRRHLLSHQGLKPYQCSTCDSRFTEKKSLLVHMRSHTGEKPYECQICFKKFSQSSILSQHMIIHKNSKPHLCHQCGKSFTQKSQLRLHELRHSGVKSHVCPSCDSSFTAKGDLIRHQKTHTGEKAFVCEQCGKTFARSQSLKEHMFKHSGIKPYPCSKCDSTFSDLSGYHKHRKKH